MPSEPSGYRSHYRILVREVTRRLRDSERVTKSIVDSWCSEFQAKFPDFYDDGMCDSVWDIVTAVDIIRERAARSPGQAICGDGKVKSPLSGPQIGQLCKVLVVHFSEDELVRLLRIRLGIVDGEIDKGGNLPNFVFNIVEFSNRRMEVDVLVDALVQERPFLKELLKGILGEPASA